MKSGILIGKAVQEVTRGGIAFMDINQSIQKLINQAISVGLISSIDEIYVRNQILSHLELSDFPQSLVLDEDEDEAMTIPDLLEEISDYAIKKKSISNFQSDRDIFTSKMMNIFLPRPSDLHRLFYEKYEQSPTEATQFFYQLSQNSNYIQTNCIAKNISYVTDTSYGKLDITINLSKPEKDPKEIAKERELGNLQSNYPQCLLCVENEGYEGRVGHPARSNHRIVGLELAGEPWYLQYSPYVYYNEHCIVLSKEHRDMKIDRGAFRRLLQFVEMFPTYFIGSNADLPIVGGSILTHDHYQGGNYEFAMARAEKDYDFSMIEYPSVKSMTIKWPLSVIRLQSMSISELVDAADHVLETWKNHSDTTVEILAVTNGIRHNTITPIARKRGKLFELDLVLRNNRTNADHPLGIFHPHQDVQHIKKENIGLIEVMGLAVLPARLKQELEEIKHYLMELPHQVADYHCAWAKELKLKYAAQSGLTDANAVEEFLRKEVGVKFVRVLEDAGVYKQNQEGLQAFKRFTALL